MELKEERKEFRKLESKGDLWGILGVSKDATQKEIKSGYVKLYKKYKPLQEKEAVDILLIVNEAYKALKDPKAVEEHCKRAYIQKEVNEFFKEKEIGKYHKKGAIVNSLINSVEISGNDYAFLKRKGKSYLIDKIANELNPLDVYITKDEYREGCTEIFIEQPSDRKIEVMVPAKTKNGEIIPIESGKHFVRVKVIPADADEIFERIEAVPQLLLVPKIFLLFGFRAPSAFLFWPILDCWTASIVKKVKIYFPFVDLNTFTSTQEIKEFIRGNAKEQYRKYNRVNEQEIIEKVIQPLSKLPKPQPFDVYITKDEYRVGCTETLIEQSTGRRIDVRIPAYTEDGEIIPINGGKHSVKVQVIPADADEIFTKILIKVTLNFPFVDLNAFDYRFKSEIKEFIKGEAKEQYRKDGYVNEHEIVEKAIQPLSSAISNIGRQVEPIGSTSVGLPSTPYKPSKTTIVPDWVKGLLILILFILLFLYGLYQYIT